METARAGSATAATLATGLRIITSALTASSSRTARFLPKMQEVKFLYQNVKLLPDRRGVRVVNQNLFVSTAAYQLRWSLLREGVCAAQGTLDMDVPGGRGGCTSVLPLPDGLAPASTRCAAASACVRRRPGPKRALSR